MGGENDNLNWYELLTSQNEYDICDDWDVADMCNENRITKMDYTLGTRIYWICGFIIFIESNKFLENFHAKIKWIMVFGFLCGLLRLWMIPDK